MATVSQKGTQKKNKGGRPRKHAKPGSTATTWKKISQPVSTHHYEVNSQGQVRRLKADGTYYDVKPWLNSGNAYLSVYIYGVKGATRNRKKVYVHRLIADAFVPGKSKGKVVHHTVGPHSNTKQTLQWVTPSQNLKARKFFNDDGSRKKRKTKTAKVQKKVKVPAQKEEIGDRDLKIQKKLESKPPEKLPLPKPQKIPKQMPPKKQDKPKPAAIDLTKDDKVERKKTAVPVKTKADKSWDWPWAKKLNWLKAKRKDFMKAWAKFRKANPKVNKKNFATIYKQVSGKDIGKEVEHSHNKVWGPKFRNAMKVISEKYK